MHRLKTIKTE